MKIIQHSRVKLIDKNFSIGNIVLRKYQCDAINAWLQNDFRGIFVMATGTGKTITAIGAMHYLLGLERNFSFSPKVIIITAPTTHLVDQWAQILKDVGYSSISCHSGNPSWEKKFKIHIIYIKNQSKKFLLVISTIATFIGTRFQNLVKKVRDLPILLISDESHNMGANKTRNSIPDFISLRLALTATPERYFDELGTNFIFGYFNKVVFKYELAESILAGYLVPYSYDLRVAILSDEEMDEYDALSFKLTQTTRKLKNIRFEKERLEIKEEIQKIKFFRRQLVVNAKHKIDQFIDILPMFESETGILIFCSSKQYSKIGKALNQAGLQYRSLRYDNHRIKERQDILKSFEQGQIPILVAINIMNEGVDLPAIRTAIFLASSTNPREFIQRRGRILRPYPEKKKARIIDFIILPPYFRLKEELHLPEPTALLFSEFDRVYEFARSSLKGLQSLLHIAYVWNNPKFLKRYEFLRSVKN